MGIFFAIIALAAWGGGDFLMQKSARRFGDWIVLFAIDAMAAVILFPLVYHELGATFTSITNIAILVSAGIMILLVALCELKALRIGKISVIEPIMALEVVVTAILGTAILREYLTTAQTLVIVLLFGGIILVATRSFHHFKTLHLERGIGLALAATAGMGLVNFLFGLGSRAMSPLMINWFTSVFIALVSFGYLTRYRQWPEFIADVKKNPALLLSVSVIDNIAWIAYSYSTLFIPISIAIGVSESYIALAALLGIWLNKEKLKPHQLAGLILCFMAVIILALIT